MKKLSSMIALGLALSLTLGMTAFAAESPGLTQAPSLEEAVKQEAKNVLSEALSGSDSAKTTELADALPEDVELPTNVDLDELLDSAVSYDIYGEFYVAESGELMIPKSLLPEITANKKWFAIHFSEDGVEFCAINFYTAAQGGSEDYIYISNVNGRSIFSFIDVSAYVKAGDDNNSNDSNDDDDATTPAPANVSPKTGETVPVAGVVTMIALAGAAVVATKKVRYNR